MRHRTRRHLSTRAMPDTRTVTPDRRCVDCGAPGTQVVAVLPRPDGNARRVLACPVHAAARGR
ncbi:hypothetical protein [Streptomyces sp. WM6378]|uniref:hypothetical protein n=1 Tax=Streptomyces sp. WM6378 TaxID=1415557 RepID=UPI000A935F8B|nr:hypothetical protein [Streptomyces sp. WM6378]